MSLRRRSGRPFDSARGRHRDQTFRGSRYSPNSCSSRWYIGLRKLVTPVMHARNGIHCHPRDSRVAAQAREDSRGSGRETSTAPGRGPSSCCGPPAAARRRAARSRPSRTRGRSSRCPVSSAISRYAASSGSSASSSPPCGNCHAPAMSARSIAEHVTVVVDDHRARAGAKILCGFPR